ncbi:MAG TPA: hypothetical protein PKD54_13945, partial [Pirellulaceae bacterium]|nr:hypothetical protein [Pirellulaceae bacterium]
GPRQHLKRAELMGCVPLDPQGKGLCPQGQGNGLCPQGQGNGLCPQGKVGGRCWAQAREA